MGNENPVRYLIKNTAREFPIVATTRGIQT